MPTGDVMRASLEGKFNNEPVIIGLGFVSNSGAADFKSDADSLYDELQVALQLNLLSSGYLNPLAASYVVDAIRISDLNPGVSASLVYPVGQNGKNTTDDAMPSNDALCVTWRTGLKGKENRGRSYLTGFAEDSQTGSYWIAEIQDWAAAGFAQPLLDAFGPVGSGNYSLSVVHTMSGGARIVPPTATPIISYSVHNEVRSLRRRGAGVRISRHRSTP